MTELKILLPALITIAIGDYLITTDLEMYQFKYFVILHFSLWFWCLIIYVSNWIITQRKPNIAGLVITSGLIMKMLSIAVIFYVLHTKLGISDLQIFNFLAMYFLYTFILIYSLSKDLNKNMIKNT